MSSKYVINVHSKSILLQPRNLTIVARLFSSWEVGSGHETILPTVLNWFVNMTNTIEQLSLTFLLSVSTCQQNRLLLIFTWMSRALEENSSKNITFPCILPLPCHFSAWLLKILGYTAASSYWVTTMASWTLAHLTSLTRGLWLPGSPWTSPSKVLVTVECHA